MYHLFTCLKKFSKSNLTKNQNWNFWWPLRPWLRTSLSFLLLSWLPDAISCPQHQKPKTLKFGPYMSPCKSISHQNWMQSNNLAGLCSIFFDRHPSLWIAKGFEGKPSSPANSHNLLVHFCGFLKHLTRGLYNLLEPRSFFDNTHLTGCHLPSLESWKGSGTVTPFTPEAPRLSGRKTFCSLWSCSCCFLNAKVFNSKKRSKPLTATGLWISWKPSVTEGVKVQSALRSSSSSRRLSSKYSAFFSCSCLILSIKSGLLA